MESIKRKDRKRIQRVFAPLLCLPHVLFPLRKKFCIQRSVQGFTLTELMVAMVIVGVLVTLGFAQYSTYKEKTYDSEAKANLRLIAAAEGIYRMEGANQYLDSQWWTLPPATGQPQETAHINDQLRLLLNASAGADRIWGYSTTVNNTANPPKFCVQATRNTTGGRTYKFVRPDDPNPVEGATCPALP